MDGIHDEKILSLNPVEMSSEVMQMLEEKELIIRLCPKHHELEVQEESFAGQSIYESSEEFGSHKLIIVTINTSTVANFGSHPDNEEFLFIGDPSAKKIYLIISLCKKDELNSKIINRTVSEKDFIALAIKYNDAEVSFFTMLKDVPHGEISVHGKGKPASFYVTEPTKLTTEIVDLGGYVFKISNG